MSRSNLIDLDLIIVRLTEMAVLVKGDEEADAVWLPLSQVETDGVAGSVGVVTMPYWLAQERGLI
ncbi:hypothetical protein PXK30_09795 [Phaeobacter gallaeciensis]|uniref:hypothetical protein n=1 Tax=Phaeobacter gallaeciensis TaxID=60890 RepID=UPI00237F0F52|nr:hypothetical protein [Phaeobacter gallaeciensis]MDE4303584.1 hypothetical protein [Phaeobacter gallaeciensis]MDE4307934.1 hypothetical protein [Phaeobacter gallaeciensis]MDE4312392.1 hypothetical protein [Phaeobacter gallaeciensis]MDE4316863.1 hypothetical protein [Phaeobacter gallaeciensis]MDE4321326.1 hypothetical protein [Phaeobacter gallaeciensis]